MRRQRWRPAELAAEVSERSGEGLTWCQLYNAARGRTAPSVVLRDWLPIILTTPLTELFTPDAASATHHAELNGWKNKR